MNNMLVPHHNSMGPGTAALYGMTQIDTNISARQPQQQQQQQMQQQQSGEVPTDDLLGFGPPPPPQPQQHQQQTSPLFQLPNNQLQPYQPQLQETHLQQHTANDDAPRSSEQVTLINATQATVQITTTSSAHAPAIPGLGKISSTKPAIDRNDALALTTPRRKIVHIPTYSCNGGLDTKFNSNPQSARPPHLHHLLSPSEYADAITALNDKVKKSRATSLDAALLVAGPLMVPLALWGARHKMQTKRRQRLIEEGVGEFNEKMGGMGRGVRLVWNKHMVGVDTGKRSGLGIYSALKIMFLLGPINPNGPPQQILSIQSGRLLACFRIPKIHIPTPLEIPTIPVIQPPHRLNFRIHPHKKLGDSLIVDIVRQIPNEQFTTPLRLHAHGLQPLPARLTSPRIGHLPTRNHLTLRRPIVLFPGSHGSVIDFYRAAHEQRPVDFLHGLGGIFGIAYFDERRSVEFTGGFVGDPLDVGDGVVEVGVEGGFGDGEGEVAEEEARDSEGVVLAGLVFVGWVIFFGGELVSGRFAVVVSEVVVVVVVVMGLIVVV
ncbi:hypothetical protein ACHAXS_010478, partial [Conticribra weissflogii]